MWFSVVCTLIDNALLHCIEHSNSEKLDHIIPININIFEIYLFIYFFILFIYLFFIIIFRYAIAYLRTGSYAPASRTEMAIRKLANVS